MDSGTIGVELVSSVVAKVAALLMMLTLTGVVGLTLAWNVLV